MGILLVYYLHVNTLAGHLLFFPGASQTYHERKGRWVL